MSNCITFSCRKYGIQVIIEVIIDLHAAPGSQNGNEHRATRDGSLEWGKTDETVQQTWTLRGPKGPPFSEKINQESIYSCLMSAQNNNKLV